MKSLVKYAAVLIATAIAAPAGAAPAPAPLVTGYIAAGYSYADFSPAKLNVLDGRIGARVGKYIGVEGEGAFGVGSDRVTVSGITADTKLTSEFAGYAIGFLPLGPKADLFARVGYGHSTVKATVPGVAGATASAGENSWNFGGGAQVFFTDKDGVRTEFTRMDYRNGGGSANIYSISYVRRFP